MIYGPTLNGSPNNERTLAEAAGYTVTVADEATWSSMTAAQFGSFNAIVFGDPTCGSDPSILTTAVNNRPTWSSASTGPKVVIGTDPVFHQGQPEANTLTTNAIRFAASGSTTGLYVNLSCYYASAAPNTPVPLLAEFGDFSVQGTNDNSVSFVDAGHPVLSGLTEAGLSNWGESIHESFTGFPASFRAVAQNASAGLPYIVASEGTEEPPEEATGGIRPGQAQALRDCTVRYFGTGDFFKKCKWPRKGWFAGISPGGQLCYRGGATLTFLIAKAGGVSSGKIDYIRSTIFFEQLVIRSGVLTWDQTGDVRELESPRFGAKTKRRVELRPVFTYLPIPEGTWRIRFRVELINARPFFLGGDKTLYRWEATTCSWDVPEGVDPFD